MQANFEQHTKWIIASLILAAAIAFLLPNSIYKTSKMEITREEAVNIARNLLSKQGINLDGYYAEGLLGTNPVESKYLVKKLGSEKFEKLVETDNFPSNGWVVYFHKNLSKEIAQISYQVVVNYKGQIVGYKREIADSTSSSSFASIQEAEQYLRNYINKNSSLNLDGFKLTDQKSFQMAKRTDYLFTWEKIMPEFDSTTLALKTRVQGNRIGYIFYNFQVPQNESGYFETIEVLFTTISVIFIFFFTLIAFYQFLKRYHQGEIWMSVGKSFFIIYFLITLAGSLNGWPGGGMNLTLGNMPFITTKAIVLTFQILIINFLLSLLLFACWSVGESLTRGLWPEKFRGIDAFIKGKFFTITTGTSLLKGVVFGLAAALIYLLVPSFTNKESAFCFINPLGQTDIYAGYFPVLEILTTALGTSILTSTAVVFFTTNLSYYKFRNTKLSIILTGLVCCLSAAIVYAPPSLNTMWLSLTIRFLAGCLFAYIYLKFDLLTLLSFVFHAIIITGGFTLYFGSTGFYKGNFVVLILLLLTIPVIYIISRIRKQEFVLEDYGLPSHVQKISERERLRKELEIASKVQLSLLPKEQPDVNGYDIAGLSIPAVEAGGDYFDFVKLEGSKLGIAIGDVSGKGVGAAIYMTLTKGILQAHAEESASPKAVLGKVNRLLYKTIEKNSFVSMFYAVLDFSSHSMVYSRAGHNPGIFCHNTDGKTKLLMSSGIALGLEEGNIFSSTLLEESIAIDEHDLVVLYTDGFTEAMNEKRDFYGEERLIEFIRAHHELSSKDLINAILKDVNKFVNHMPQHDDMTIVVIKRQ
jgi:Na+-transporting methylmalonyl-CoA/oxaloacetate decarboxylase gamma subunit